jgi:protein gp37
VRTSAINWRERLKWNTRHEAFFAEHGRRQRVFCASIADVFDNEVPASWRVDLFDLIRTTPNLDWLLLTKRIGNVRRMLQDAADHAFNHRRDDLHQWLVSWLDGDAPLNVWLGATIVNQEEADRDIPKLFAVPARARFLSMELLLGPVSLR